MSPQLTPEELIARFWAKLPEDWLILLGTTQAQQEHWLGCRIYQQMLSDCWRARHSGFSDPLAPARERGEIDRLTHERIWGLVDFYQRLWALIQLSETLVRQTFQEAGHPYPFPLARNYFEAILQEAATCQFLICLEPHAELSGGAEGKMTKEFRVLHKELSGEPVLPSDLPKKPQKLPARETVSPLLGIVIYVCEHRAKPRKDRLVKTALTDFYQAAVRIAGLSAKSLREKGSMAWSRGEVLKGKRGGYTNGPS